MAALTVCWTGPGPSPGGEPVLDGDSIIIARVGGVGPWRGVAFPPPVGSKILFFGGGGWGSVTYNPAGGQLVEALP